jgi:hypothetical protein
MRITHDERAERINSYPVQLLSKIVNPYLTIAYLYSPCIIATFVSRTPGRDICARHYSAHTFDHIHTQILQSKLLGHFKQSPISRWLRTSLYINPDKTIVARINTSTLEILYIAYPFLTSWPRPANRSNSGVEPKHRVGPIRNLDFACRMSMGNARWHSTPTSLPTAKFLSHTQ